MMLRIVLVACAVMAIGCGSRQTISKDEKKTESTITFTGGNGDSYDSAIVINGVEKKSDGVAAEYRYISTIYGEKDKAWSISGQTVAREGKKIYEIIEIDLIPSAEKRIYYFDVTKFPQKSEGSKLEIRIY